MKLEEFVQEVIKIKHNIYLVWLYNTIGVIDGGSGDVVIYNTGVSVAGTEERLLLPHEAQLVMAHGIINFNFCLFQSLSLSLKK